MDIISFDPSLRSTGVYYRVDGVEKSFTIQSHSSMERMDVLAEHIDRIMQFLASFNKMTVKCIAVVEGYAYGFKNSRSMCQLAEVGGIVRGVLRYYRIPVIEIPPMVWKSITLGSQNIRAKKYTAKDKMFYHMLVAQKVGPPFETTDEADAYMMAWAFEQIVKGIGGLSPGAHEIRSRAENIGVVTTDEQGALKFA